MKCSEALQILKKQGWRVKSQKGSHIKMIHQDIEGVIIFPLHTSKEIGKGLWNRIKKQAGIQDL